MRLAKMSLDEKTAAIDAMISAMNRSPCEVFAIMDYWTFEGWFALKNRLADKSAPSLEKLVFPGIELRLDAPTTYRLNAHVLFSDQTTNQELIDFKSRLEVALIDQPLSDECLIKLARELGTDLLRSMGFERADILKDAEKALLVGAQSAQVTVESYKRAIAGVPDNKAIGFMPWDTNDGLKRADWREHYACVMGLMKASPIFESRNETFYSAFAGLRNVTNAPWFDDFQAALDHIPRLAVSGSDAHAFNEYGVFPSDKKTWIKADPTFLGLLQAIKEPAKRSFIGAMPDKLADIAQQKTFYIDKVDVQRNPDCGVQELWLHNCRIPLNPDLVAIIGNKGSGKSALADVLALLGNSRQKLHFAFLKKDRFRGKGGEPAKHFVGALTWRDGTRHERNLNEDPLIEHVELVRYIPQGHFENVCNEHASGRSVAFEGELRAVIFDHADDALRQGALDFDQLIDQQERGYRHRLTELRGQLVRVNEEIVSMETQLQPQVRRGLQELLTLKLRQIDEHNKIRPKEEERPSEAPSPEQQAIADKVRDIADSLRQIEARNTERAASTTKLVRRKRAIQNIRGHLQTLQRAYDQFKSDALDDFNLLGSSAEDVATLSISFAPLEEIESGFKPEQDRLDASGANDLRERESLLSQQIAYRGQLNAPGLKYQESVQAIQEWSSLLQSLIGAPDQPETRLGIEARIAQLDQLPSQLQEKRNVRIQISRNIFEVLEEQRRARERLFSPVQDLIQRNSLIRDEYKLQFQATLITAFDALAESLFAVVKQTSAEFRETDNYAAIRRIADRHPMDTSDGTVGFVSELNAVVERAAAAGDHNYIGISNALKKNHSANEVYDLLYGLSFIEPRYSLLFQDTRIEQLSPGQRGALLLIFYLLVDKGHNPIILDQPEENLDNQTVVSLLVPVLAEAKKRRQIIMVTHNPNLAVVCDAEQIIYSSFDRKGRSEISYTSGSIENPVINVHVVNVLEGTRPAFDNRGGKYQGGSSRL
jgi:ABC-type Mn2+/Zn2+ transport system ATPase subunit